MTKETYSPRNNDGFAMVIVIILLMLSMFVITSSWHVLTLFTKNGELQTLHSEAQNLLDSQRTSFKNVLIHTNTDGGGYSTNGLGREDENGDDDDFLGGAYDVDGHADDDGTAFAYKFGFVLPASRQNILFIDQKYTDITGWNSNSLSAFSIFSSANAECTVEIYDGNIYRETGEFVLKKRKTESLQSSENLVPLDSSDTSSNDLILVFIQNLGPDTISYSLGGRDLQWAVMPYFLPARNTDRNVDLYTNVILADKDGKYIAFDQMYYEILPGGKKPISPTYLHMGTASGTTLTLEWDINDKTNTGSYYLYRSTDSSVDCNDLYFFRKIPDGYRENSVEVEYGSGTYYFSLCASNSTGSGQDTGKMSQRSNILKITK